MVKLNFWAAKKMVNSRRTKNNNLLREYYYNLLDAYGPQGWWPILELDDSKRGKNPTKTGSVKGYHPEDYSYPRNTAQQFQICIGAILTQNTSWTNVEKALLNLKIAKALDLKSIKSLSNEKLKELIKPAGYYNQKEVYIREFIKFYESLIISKRIPSREELLAVKGIGPETADSMLLYAFKVPTFVIDAYTRRIFSHLGFFSEKASYFELKAVFETALPPNLIIYQEYHALIVEHAKRENVKNTKEKNQ
jgi:endonuclease III related protein